MIRHLTLLLLWANPGTAQVLTLPGNALLEAELATPSDSYALPTGAWDGIEVPSQIVEGDVTTQVWRIPADGLATLQLLRPLRDQVRQAGYDVMFDCDTDDCGGFDFRFGTEVAPPPEMLVNLADFRFLSATRRTDGGVQGIGILISSTPQAGYVQIIRVAPSGIAPAPTGTQAPAVSSPQPVSGGLSAALDGTGHAVLDGVTFATGATSLSGGDVPSLAALAAYMTANPTLTVAIVGHTDSDGNLDANIDLSRQRAAAVRDRLIADHGVSADRLTAAGMGYLSPVASNLTPDGRAANRRVEAVVTGPID
ncbi:OmpA-OmpF porin, OOP family [Loktanella fryxellensis]|uniref:OmpA-OmpF porin, OOP family n=1 Tax=Loktanella fryxellensis TaxID=245187 RepID=A0A1H8FP51_9RHOB|nr:OmpA family protein [Loktanella fryxellensis]SEN32878.1 OmpA-OmpF porin, OOP family [Loktanella fryxellensis]